MLDKDLGDKLKTIFSNLKIEDCNSYVCVDCEKDLGDLNLDLELKKQCPLRNDGKLMVFCSDCIENES